MLHRTNHIPGFSSRILLSVSIVIGILLASSLSPAWAEVDKRIIKVMTRNMDAGTDFLYFFFEPDPAVALQKTYAEISTNDFAGRAARIADEIAGQQPYLISLQEVTLWQLISTSSGPSDLADQLPLLLTALAARNQHYSIVAIQELTDISLPLTPDYSLLLRYLDRNVILARSDLKPSELTLSNVRMKIYKATIQPIPGLPFKELNGWISVDANVRGKSIRFFNTHLESPVSPDDPTQLLQGLELILTMRLSRLPVVLAGDFNSDAEHTGLWTDQTPTYDWIVAAGFSDVWPIEHPDEQGLTWPLFFEDFLALNPTVPLERIDIIFMRGLGVLDVERTGLEPPFGSDHTGVVATLLIAK